MNEPYYESQTRRLYRFPNGHGASVVETHPGAFELAVIKHTGEMMMGQERWYIDYYTPFGPPKSDLTDDEVTKHLAVIESYPMSAKEAK